MRYLIIIIMLATPSFALSAVEKPLFEFKVSGTDCGNASKETTIETEYKGTDIATSVRFSINCAYVPHKLGIGNRGLKGIGGIGDRKE